MDTRLMDHRHGYGLVTRTFHWLMALLLLWQAVSVVLRVTVDDTPLADFFFGYHFSNGVLILALAVLRGAWGLLNLSRRPPHDRPIERLAALAHVAMYALLIVVPGVALIRAFGSDRAFSALGLSIFEGRETEVEWMTGLGSQWHGLLGWTLLALIVGHIVMAWVHTRVWKEPLIRRMTRGSDRE
ncbi:cytochrome b561 [Halomonas sp. THAF12]|uniref:cytochrome b n=1 Tax=Halomonas TaxID=2745 RepID=UPI0003169691|nr:MULTISPECIES: cytochrome b [Halomonas]QFT83800.1 cytochrome b561 [Halomonas sp. THAF12]